MPSIDCALVLVNGMELLVSKHSGHEGREFSVIRDMATRTGLSPEDWVVVLLEDALKLLSGQRLCEYHCVGSEEDLKKRCGAPIRSELRR